MIGQIISNYRIISIIGEGGMGIVYLAQHIHIHRKAAIKSLHRKYLTNYNIKERFKNEAATLSQIQHPNIVKLYDYIETGDGLYLIMEYVDGVLLDLFIKNESGPIKESNSIKIMNGLLSGFSYAHSKNIVHRDVKPSNIMISRDFSVVKILDFGIAKILSDDIRNLTKDGTQMGTVYYMSPEQVKGAKLDNRSDIYSLGVTFFQMLTGTNPYEKITSEFEIYNMITQAELPDVKTIYPYVSDKAEHIIRKATRKNPLERYKNCNEVIAELNETNERPIVKSVSHNTQVEITATPENNNTNLFIGLGASLVFLIIIVGFIAAHNTSTSAQTADEKVTDDSSTLSSTNTPRADTAPLAIKVDELRQSPPDTFIKNYVNGEEEKFNYTGTLSITNNKPQGLGNAKYRNGDNYSGEFINGLKEGKGIYTWNDGSYFDGTFKNNIYDGYGEYYDANSKKKQSMLYKNGKLIP
jgi:serine/threonine protein kinase